MDNPIIWFNGALLPRSEARIDPYDRGFTLGDGLFETMRAIGGRALRQSAHLARLSRGARTIRLKIPPIDWNGAFAAVLGANGLSDAALRLTVTRGEAPRGLLPPENARPTIVLMPSPVPPPLPPARCILATVTRRNEHSPLCRVKVLNGLDSLLARQEAMDRGADEAILLNTRGGVAEGSASNLFVVKDGTVATPPQTDGILPGIMRETIVLATHAEERSLTSEDLFAADELFLTNSLGIRAIASLNGRPIGNGSQRASLQLADHLFVD